MTISISASLVINIERPTDLLLQFEAAAIPEQSILESNTHLPQSEHLARVAAQDDIGERIWLRTQGRIECTHRARVNVERTTADLERLNQLPPHQLPGETVSYLFDSRYCPADQFQTLVQSEFGDLSGGAKVTAMRGWIAENIAYEAGSSDPRTTALDTYIERRGICRDFAHVLITLARASGIPARYVSVYAPGVTPQDFHAVAEVFLADGNGEGGRWHIVDATGMADTAQTVKIGVGRDAADVSFLTSFGATQMLEQTIDVVAE